MANGKIETYEESARVIALWLDEFCDKKLPYPSMIAEAARQASEKIENLRKTLDTAHDELIDVEENLDRTRKQCDGIEYLLERNSYEKVIRSEIKKEVDQKTG